MWGVGLRPATVAHLRDYIVAVKALLHGEEADYRGRRFRMQWSDLPSGHDIAVIVPVSGPKVLRMACEVSDGMLLSMGFGTHNVDYVRSLVEEGCRSAGRDPDELELWWNSEVVFGDSIDDALSRGMGVGTEWLTMGTLEGKQIPDHLKQALVQFNADSHNLGSEYQDESRERALIDRAKQLGALRLAPVEGAGAVGHPPPTSPGACGSWRPRGWTDGCSMWAAARATA